MALAAYPREGVKMPPAVIEEESLCKCIRPPEPASPKSNYVQKDKFDDNFRFEDRTRFHPTHNAALTSLRKQQPKTDFADWPLWEPDDFLKWFENSSCVEDSRLIADALVAICRDSTDLHDRLYVKLKSDHLDRWKQRILMDVLAEFDYQCLWELAIEGISSTILGQYELSCVVQARRISIPREHIATVHNALKNLAQFLGAREPANGLLCLRILGQTLRSSAALATEPDLAFYMRFLDWPHDRQNMVRRDSYDSIGLLLCRFAYVIDSRAAADLANTICRHLEVVSRPDVRDYSEVMAEACLLLRVASSRLGPEFDQVAEWVYGRKDRQHADTLRRFIERARNHHKESWQSRPPGTKADIDQVLSRL